MKKVTKSYEVFTFDELTPEIQAEVLDKNRDINTDYNWHEDVYEEHKTILEANGFKDVEISFSGFWSQGDGASFTTDSFDFAKFNEVHKVITDTRILKLIHNGNIEISGVVKRHNHHYVHERSTSFNYEYNIYDGKYTDYANIEAFLQGIEDKFDSILVDLNKAIYKALEDRYEDLISDEAIKSTFEANEYEFLADGKMFTE